MTDQLAFAIDALASPPAGMRKGPDGSVAARQIASATSGVWVIGPALSRTLVMKHSTIDA